MNFLATSSNKIRLLEDSFNRVRKNYTVEKKISWKKWVREKSYDHNGHNFKITKIFSEKKYSKKSKMSKKNFLKVVISFLNMARKKSFFFENFFGPDFDPKKEERA